MRHLFITAIALVLGLVVTWATAAALEQVQAGQVPQSHADSPVVEPLLTSSQGSMFTTSTSAF